MGKREHWLIGEEEVTLMPENALGRDSFGVVLRGFLYGATLAMKIPLGALSTKTIKALPELSDELRILRHPRHPNLVLLHSR